jgi:diguanylate cyclase (GGDEF)-like protein
VPDHSVPPEMADSVRRWAAGLRNADDAELETQVLRIAREFQAACESAGERFSVFHQNHPNGVLITDSTDPPDAHHDPVTGLPAGTRLRAELTRLLAAGRQLTLLLVDLDGFAVVTDGLGFDAADEVLRGVAARLREAFAAYQAFLARLPGDSFAVVLAGPVDQDAVTASTEAAIAALARPVYVDGIGIGVSASVGIVTAGGDSGTNSGADSDTDGDTGGDQAAVLRSAQIALHRAKELGKSRWVWFDPVSGGADRERYRLACGIAGALESGEMAVVYKPHVVLPDAQVVASLNVTLRWHHPTLGELRPEQFYPLAEATGMTVPLGRFLLAEALRTAGDWRVRFGDDAPMVCLALPRRMAIDGDLVRSVQTELDRNGLEHRHIMLCTDGAALLDERGDLLEALGELAEAGVVFGVYITGMPELELLPALQVPAPAVMLTGPIIDALEIDAPPAWAVRNIRQLAERAAELGITVGAYGVPSQEHADLLFEVGVAVAAGPYLPTYASSADAETWVGRVLPMG